jgi:hypothetical protein
MWKILKKFSMSDRIFLSNINMSNFIIAYKLQHNKMDLMKSLNTIDNPTPKLKSSPIPIKFISFNQNDIKCIYCKELYMYISVTGQQYCKKCLSCYLTNITDNNIYLDVYYTMNSECIEHEIKTKEPQVIQECCKNCLEVLCFKQIFAYDFVLSNFWNDCNKIFDNSDKYCKLCGKSLYQGTDTLEMKLCSDCYLISSDHIEQTLSKMPILVTYLPWWHNISFCEACNTLLIFTSDCQKYCGKCLIFYIGCRYCLTTNIIFGLTTQSQCKKCKRVSSVDIIFSGNSELDEFLLGLFPNIHNNLKTDEIIDKMKNIDKYFLPSEISLTINTMCKHSSTQSTQSENLMKWIQYSHFTNVTEIARGGFGIIYRATWDQKSAILKKFKNFQDTSKYFLNEVETIPLIVLFVL